MPRRGDAMSHATVALSLTFSLGLITCGAVSHAAPLPPPEAPQANPHKALLIGVDGLQYEKLRQAIKQGMAPNLARLQLAKSYVGGIDGTTTEQTTGSGPGWTTIHRPPRLRRRAPWGPAKLRVRGRGLWVFWSPCSDLQLTDGSAAAPSFSRAWRRNDEGQVLHAGSFIKSCKRSLMLPDKYLRSMLCAPFPIGINLLFLT